MNTSHNKYDSIEKLIFDSDLRIQNVEVKPEINKLLVFLNSQHLLVLPLSSYQGLSGANKKALHQFEIIADGTGVHWPELDEDLSLKGFLKDALRRLVIENDQIVA